MIHILILLVVLGVVFYCIDLIPMSAPFPAIIRVIAVLIALFPHFCFLFIHGRPLAS